MRRDLRKPCMEVMNFLNEAAERYSGAISFAAGRPPDRSIATQCTAAWVARFVRERRLASGGSEQAIWQSLGQYGPAGGVIADLIARMLVRDEGLQATPDELMVTNGMQEAVLLLLLAICEPQHDAVLSDDPTYVGLTGAAALCWVPVIPLTGAGEVVERAERAIAEAQARGRNPRLLYLVADFSNPLGHTLTLAEREALVALAVREQMLLIEDTAYRLFRYEGEALPTLKALDRNRVVVQVGSFSKLLMPGIRAGYIYADQQVPSGSPGARSTLIKELTQVKSFVSVLTSPLAQAMVGGFLFEQGFSLREWNRPKVDLCRGSRDAMLTALEEQLTVHPALRGRVCWVKPEGGFFLSLKVPFRFGTEEMMSCARDHGVVACPMAYFSEGSEYEDYVRLSFSNTTATAARTGVERLFNYLEEEMVRRER